MKPRIGVLLPLLMVAYGAQAQQAPGVISGTVVEAGLNKPLARVSLELKPFVTPPAAGILSAPPPPPSAPVAAPRYPGLTNDNGQFVLRNIPPGRYMLTASRNGYVHADYGQRGPNGKAVPLIVAAGQQLAGIQLSITRAAAISGTIHDSNGAPYPYMQMHARRVSYPEGRRTLTITGSTYTDDLGEYRIYGLPPGQYVLSAEGETTSQGILPVAASLAPPLPGSVVIQGIGGSMGYTPDPANQRKPAQRAAGGVSPVYYRNAISDRDAWTIELRAGDDLKGVDINVGAGPAKVPVSISAPADSGNVRLVVSPGLNVAMLNSLRGPSNFPMAPGSYVGVATGTDSANRPLTGYVVFDVSPLNTPGVNLVLNPPVPVSGRIVLEGRPAGATDADLAKLRIRLRRNPPLPGIPELSVSASAAGAFTSPVPIDGDYAIEVSGFPESLRDRYLKVADNIHISGQPVNDLEIVLGAGGGQIDGAALSETGTPLANVTVVLVPEQRDRMDLYKSLDTDGSGRFRFEGLAPGRYLLFSWEDVEADAWYNPEFIRALEDRAKPVSISEGSRQNIDAAIIPIR